MINIIGAGPAGLMTAIELAKHRGDVTVYEEHKEIGKPVQCTGIVTEELSKIIPIADEFLVNRLKHVKVYSNTKSVTLPANDILFSIFNFCAKRINSSFKGPSPKIFKCTGIF